MLLDYRLGASPYGNPFWGTDWEPGFGNRETVSKGNRGNQRKGEPMQVPLNNCRLVFGQALTLRGTTLGWVRVPR